MRVVFYRRVSSPKQRDGVSLQDQLDLCRAHAVAQGWTEAGDYLEDGRSAFTEKIEKRPALQQLIADARLRRFDVVLVYKMNRFARKVLLQYQVAADLERQKVQIASCTESIDRTTASGRLTFGVLAVLAEAQSDQLSEKMRATRLAEAKAGRHTGPVPVGYVRVEGQLQIDPAGAELVRVATAFYMTGLMGAAEIAFQLQIEGYRLPSGKVPTTYQIEEMLKCPVYAGFVTCKDEVFSGLHEPLWSPAEWARIQEIAEQRSRRYSKPAVAHNPLLAGILYCANCGAPAWYHAGYARLYLCSHARTARPSNVPGLRCRGLSIKADAVERRIQEIIEGVALTPGLVERTRQLMRHEKPRPVVDLARALSDLKQHFLNEELSAAEYETRRKVLQSQGSVTPMVVDRSAEVLALATNLPALFAEANANERQRLIRLLVTEVYARKDQLLAIRPTQTAAPILEAAVLMNGRGNGPGGDPAPLYHEALKFSLLEAA